MAVLPDGRVVSGSDDRTLRVWDPDSGEAAARWTIDAPVFAVATIRYGWIAVDDSAGGVHFVRVVQEARGGAA